MPIARVHSFLVHPSKNEEEQPPISGTLIPRQGPLYEMLAGVGCSIKHEENQVKGVIEEYQRRYDSFLQRIAGNLEKHLRDQLTGIEHVDRVSARAKSPERLATK